MTKLLIVLFSLLSSTAFTQEQQDECPDCYLEGKTNQVIRKNSLLGLGLNLTSEGGGNQVSLMKQEGTLIRGGRSKKLIVDLETGFDYRSHISDSTLSLGVGTAIVNNEDILLGVVLTGGFDSTQSESNDIKNNGGWSYGAKTIIASFDDRLQMALETNRTFNQELSVVRAFASYCTKEDRRAGSFSFEAECKRFTGETTFGEVVDYGVLEVTALKNYALKGSSNLSGMQFGPYVSVQDQSVNAGLTLRLNYSNH